MTELPPADWYIDPEDSNLYRYWDGSSWTEHRAPRHTSPLDTAQRESVDLSQSHAETSGLRAIGELLSGSFSLMKRHRNIGVLYIVANALGSVLFIIGLIFAIDRILLGRLDEVLNKISEPDFDPFSSDSEAFFESIQFDWSAFNMMLLALIPLLMLTISGIVSIATVHVIDSDLRDRTTSLPEALSHAMNRLLRFIGLIAQICILAMVLILAVIIIATAVPPLLILLIPASIAAVLAAIPIISLSFVVASIGPHESSVLYAIRLIKGQFWTVLGRILLLFIILIAVNLTISSIMISLGATTGSLWFIPDLINSILGSAMNFFFTIAVVMIYLDLDGISQERDH